MINAVVFFAQVEIDEYLRQRATEPAIQRPSYESMILFGALLALALGLFVWAYFMYQRRCRRLARHRRSSSVSVSDAGSVASASSGGRRRRKRHRRRREHRPRNPTLAETGGLPPIRPEDQPPPPI